MADDRSGCGIWQADERGTRADAVTRPDSECSSTDVDARHPSSDVDIESVRRIVDALPGDYVVYWIVGGSMRILHYTPSILKSFDATAADFDAATAGNALDVVLPADRASVFSMVAGKPVGPEEIDCVFRLLHRTRGFFWVHARSKIIGTYKGGTVCLTNYLNRSAETELHLDMLDMSPTDALVIDRNTHEVLYMNAAAKRDMVSADTRFSPVRTCHELFHGRTDPCEDCPMVFLGSGDTVCYDKHDRERGRWVDITMKQVDWCGHDATVQLITDITGTRDAALTLLQTQKRYEVATHGANIAVWEYDPHTHCIDAPAGGMAHLEKPDHIENVPESILHQFKDEDKPKAIEFFKAVDRGQPTVKGDFWMKGENGRAPYCMRFLYTNVFDEKGNVAKAYAVGQDVTVYKEDEEEYDRFLKELLFSNKDAIGAFHMNLTQDICDNGVSPTSYIGDFQESGTVDGFFEASGRIIADADDLLYYQENFNRQALIARFEKGEDKLSHRFHDRMENGEVHPVDTIINMVRNPRNGDVEGVIYSYDEYEHVLQDEIVQHITNVEFDFVALIDVRKRVIRFRFVNDATEKVSRLQELDYDGEFLPSAESYIVPEERESRRSLATIENIVLELERRGVFSFTFSQPGDAGVARKQIEYCWLEREHGLILAIKSDITHIYRQEQKARQQVEDALVEARKANDAKSAFLSNVSHDMRTPLNGIIGFTGLALENDDIVRKQEYLEKIRVSGTLLKSLVDDTLDLSRIESGRYVLNPAVYRSHALLEDVSASIRAAADTKGVRYVEDYSHARDGLARIDKLADQKVFLNLLSNAVKFTPEGGTVTLTVKDVPVREDGTNAVITVSDTGIGMAPDFLPSVFEPFLQENPSEEGTGLGLSIAKRLVVLMGGRLEVASRKGVGTTFTVYLPIDWVDDDDAVAQDAERSFAADARGLAGLRVLLVEDNAMNTEIARTLLEHDGASVVCAVNGKQGVDTFKASACGAFDAVLMDIRMPVMDGYAAARAIRALDRSDARSVRIIAMSADAFDSDVSKSIEAGMDAHIAKPIDPQKLRGELLKAR